MEDALNTLKTILDKAESAGISGAEALQESGIKKEELAACAQAGDLSAAILLLLGMVSHRIKKWQEETFDEDTGETIWIERKKVLDEFIYDSEPNDIEAFEQLISSVLEGQSDSFLLMCWDLFDQDRTPMPIVSALADRGVVKALEWLGNFYAGSYSMDYDFPVDKAKAVDYYQKSLDAGLCREQFDMDLLRLEYGLKWQDSFDWVFHCLGFYVLQDNLDWNVDTDWSFDDCWLNVVGVLFRDELPRPTQKSFDTAEVKLCTIDALKKELINNGLPESAFHQSGEGLVVEMRNISFYIKYTPYEEREWPEALLAISDPFCRSHPYSKYVPSFVDEDDFVKETIDAETFAYVMSYVDERVPAVKLAIRLVYDKLMEARKAKPERTKEAKILLEEVLGGRIPDGLSVRAQYVYGEEGGREKKYCREVVTFEFERHSYVLEIEYDDLKSIPTILFKWFTCGNEDTWGVFHRINLTYRVRIELDEKKGELLVIQDSELNEPLITPPEALTLEMLDAYNRQYLQEHHFFTGWA